MPAPASIRSDIGNVELNIDQATRICWGILSGGKKSRGNFKPLFRAFPEVCAEDVLQEMLLSICRQWCTYDPKQSQPQTFFHQRAHSAMLDMHRRCKSGKAKVKRVVQRAREEDFHHHDPDPADSDRPLAEMLADNLKVARKLFGKRCFKRGRKRYTMPQEIALAMLMRQVKIGNRRAHAMLVARVELGAVIGLKTIPNRRTLARAAVALRNFETANTPTPDAGDNIPAPCHRSGKAKGQNGVNVAGCCHHRPENSRTRDFARTTALA